MRKPPNTLCPNCQVPKTKVQRLHIDDDENIVKGNYDYFCWNLGECRMAKDLAKIKAWEVVTDP